MREGSSKSAQAEAYSAKARPGLAGKDWQNTSPRLPASYSLALQELAEIESQPLCHRIAARLLVNNCQLLENHDEASVLIDTGREARDFVDSYAASLAICDLERGSFKIPDTCTKFQERHMGNIAVPSKPELHVTAREIDACLEGLAQSDSAWSTWVSYRHKALRFCDTARTENEQNKKVRVYERVTKIMARMSESVGLELDTLLSNFHERLRTANTEMDGVGPRIQFLGRQIHDINEYVTNHVKETAQLSVKLTEQFDAEMQGLKQRLTGLQSSVEQGSRDIVAAQHSALQSAQHELKLELGLVHSYMVEVRGRSELLYQHMASIEKSALGNLIRQKNFERKLLKLDQLAQNISIKYLQHDADLDGAHAKLWQMLVVLEDMKESTLHLGTALTQSSGLSSWWPYFYCPLATLWMGSYGLRPSISRNLLLAAIGEIAGFLVSTTSTVINHHSPRRNAQADIVGWPLLARQQFDRYSGMLGFGSSPESTKETSSMTNSTEPPLFHLHLDTELN